MSSTNRGAERQPNDLYETPVETTLAMLPWLPCWTPRSVLDPCCGSGAILNACRTHWPDVETRGIEIDGATADRTIGSPHRVAVGDALSLPWPAVDIVVMNPPYSLAEQFVRRAYETAWMVVALLPLAFLGSEDGESLVERVDMPDVYLLSTRQSFIGSTAGPHDSAWMVWDVGGNGGRIRRLKSVCRAAARKEE